MLKVVAPLIAYTYPLRPQDALGSNRIPLRVPYRSRAINGGLPRQPRN
jgi:hypothetical protein